MGTALLIVYSIAVLVATLFLVDRAMARVVNSCVRATNAILADARRRTVAILEDTERSN